MFASAPREREQHNEMRKERDGLRGRGGEDRKRRRGPLFEMHRCVRGKKEKKGPAVSSVCVCVCVCVFACAGMARTHSRGQFCVLGGALAYCVCVLLTHGWLHGAPD